MSLYNSDYFIRLSENKSVTLRDKIFSERTQKHTGFDIFLSHSNLDRKLVEGIYIELTSKGFSVYVDWIIDPHLDRNNVTKETAELIRSRMKSSRKLLLAMSTNVSLSKWIPWELGFVDGKTNRCALFPVSPGSSTQAVFHRSGYLLLYPYLKKARIFNSEDLYLTDAAHSFVLADSWIRRDANLIYNNTNIDVL
ncbi:TIR domain-containing protein [Lacibacter luteus]|uniref:TIR domain-containing protein n=1 Tax=Lacibacter luteus TaxID=2508719 RepID=A0A4Q1CI37_9BACT|nr:toll/interleukin-1 receptor domain-containing protein [Lacibacter luteus]RXK60033.1 TIR domain-containing protein [Lacibacter luteus]